MASPRKTVPTEYQSRVAETRRVLADGQINNSERSALTLLALLNLGPKDPWAQAQNPKRRVAEIIDFIAAHYEVAYAPNTRETIRKSSLKPLLDAGWLASNPEAPRKAKSSPDFGYQIRAEWLNRLRRVGQTGEAKAAFPPPSDSLPLSSIVSDSLPLSSSLRLNKVRLKNFRSFADTGVVELRPLVLLLGQNSSGKSSFLRLFPLLRQTMEERSDSPLLWLGKDVDFGDFTRALRHAPGVDSMEIELHASMSIVRLEGSHGYIEDMPMILRAELGEHEGQTALNASSIRFKKHDHLFRFAADRTLLSLQIDHEPAIATEDFRLVTDPGSLFPKISGYPSAISGFALKDVFDTVNMISGAVLPAWSKRIHYMGPIRQGPLRFYRSRNLRAEQLDSDGRNLVDFLLKLDSQQWDHFSMWTQTIFGFQIRVRRDGTSHHVIELIQGDRVTNLIDIGFGFSQVIPVIAQVWASSRITKQMHLFGNGGSVPPSLLAFEQPELHLHPHYQALLGNMFAGLVNNTTTADQRPQLLVETHSEALVNRIGQLVSQKKLDPADVSIVLFDKDPKTDITTVRPTEFNSKGFLKDWPIGFFAP